MSARAALENPMFLALDVDTVERAFALIESTKAYVGGYKIGPRLCLRFGRDFIAEVARHGQLFIDNKHYDIPSTMESAVRASFELGASFCTIHAQAGSEALERLAKVESELCRERPFRILAVTVLTSFTPDTLAPNVAARSIADQVTELTKLTIDSGLTGIVCSPEEVERLRRLFPTSYLVTPGVRLSTDDRGDQKRVADPRSAIERGASALVVGRPIYESPEPAHAAKTYHEEIQKNRPSSRS